MLDKQQALDNDIAMSNNVDGNPKALNSLQMQLQTNWLTSKITRKNKKEFSLEKQTKYQFPKACTLSGAKATLSWTLKL